MFSATSGAVTADKTVSLDGLSSWAIHFSSIFATLSLESIVSFLAQPERSADPPQVSQSCETVPFCTTPNMGTAARIRIRNLADFVIVSKIEAQLALEGALVGLGVDDSEIAACERRHARSRGDAIVE